MQELVLPRYERLRYAGGVNVDKMSVSFDHKLGEAVRVAARHSGGSLSAWLAEAAAARLRADALAEFLDGWESEHGPLSASELNTAAAELATPEFSKPAR